MRNKLIMVGIVVGLVLIILVALTDLLHGSVLDRDGIKFIEQGTDRIFLVEGNGSITEYELSNVESIQLAMKLNETPLKMKIGRFMNYGLGPLILGAIGVTQTKYPVLVPYLVAGFLLDTSIGTGLYFSGRGEKFELVDTILWVLKENEEIEITRDMLNDYQIIVIPTVCQIQSGKLFGSVLQKRNGKQECAEIIEIVEKAKVRKIEGAIEITASKTRVIKRVVIIRKKRERERFDPYPYLSPCPYLI